MAAIAIMPFFTTGLLVFDTIMLATIVWREYKEIMDPWETLGETRIMTFHRDTWTKDRDARDYSRELRCKSEGTAGCDFDLNQITCFNKGESAGKVKWHCRAPKVIEFPYRFGRTDVWCSRSSNVNNPNITFRWNEKHGCGLIYSVEYVVNPYWAYFVSGLLLALGILRLREKYFSPAPPPGNTQPRNPYEIIFDNKYNDYYWGESLRREQMKMMGPHTVNAMTRRPEVATKRVQEKWDRVGLDSNKNNAVIDDKDGALHRSGSSLIRLSSRTSTRASVPRFASSQSQGHINLIN